MVLVFTPQNEVHLALLNESGVLAGTRCCSGWLPRGAVAEEAPLQWLSCAMCVRVASAASYIEG